MEDKRNKDKRMCHDNCTFGSKCDESVNISNKHARASVDLLLSGTHGFTTPPLSDNISLQIVQSPAESLVN